MDVDAVRSRVFSAAWVAVGLVVAGMFGLYAAADQASRTLDSSVGVFVVVAWLLLGAGGMLGTAAAVGWVVTARSPGND